MNILVTGGAGFIGANLVQYLVNTYPKDQIYNLDALTYAGNLESLIPVEDKPNYHFIHMDITDRPAIFQLFEKENFDIVINVAAESHVDRSISNPDIFIQTNIGGTQVLLDAS
ncbi:MAG TPA: NAD-dependent epimerase/dehydratase family protein, partial [Clostridiaceae bacterium]|nr:NAD-dependent epimerase/dehydratase family protein [Clostridiaceae bacterium]